MWNSKKTKLLKILSLTTLAITPVVFTFSCVNKNKQQKQGIAKQIENINIFISNKVDKMASAIQDSDISFSNYDDKEYEVSIISKTPNDETGELEINIKLFQKGKENTFVTKKLVINGFKKKNEIDLNPNKDNKFEKAENIIKKDEKINYLAIGDSVSAGFTAALDKDYHGKMVNGKIEGMSFPVYLAYYLNKDNPQRVKSFDNFATSNSTILEWLDLLDETYNSKRPEIFKNEDGIYKHTFDGRYENKEEFKKLLVQKIKQSNLMTITLGANDFLRFFSSVLEAVNFNELINDFQKNNKIDYEKLSALYKKFTDICKEEITDRLVTLLNKINSINSKTNVVLFNYPAPFLRFLSMIHSLFPNNIQLSGETENLMLQFMQPLTNAIKEAKQKVGKNIYFVDAFDASYWNENQEVLTSVVFDIHPTVYGYKKMAMDAFVKLTANTIKNETLYNLGWSKKYLSSFSKDNNKQIIELTTEDSKKLYEDNIGKNKQEVINKLLEEEEVILHIKDKLDPKRISRRLINFTNNQIKEIFLSILKKSFNIQIIKDIDPNNDIYNFFKNKEGAADKLVSWIKQSKFISSQLDEFQKQLLEKDWDKDGKSGAKILKKEYIVDLLNQTFLKQENILNLIKDFAKSDFATSFKEDLSTLVEKISKNILKNDAINNLIKDSAKKLNKKQEYISNEDLDIFLSKLMHSNKLPKLISEQLKNIINNAQHNANEEEFKNINTISKLLKFIYKSQAENLELQEAFSETFKEFISNEELKPILVRIICNVINKDPNINKLFKEINSEEQTKLIGSILSVFVEIENNFDISKVLANGMISELGHNGLKFKFNYLSEAFIKYSHKTFSDEKNIIKIVKIIKINDELNNNIELVKKFLSNAFDIVKEKPNLKDIILNNKNINNLIGTNSEEEKQLTKDLLDFIINQASLKQIFNFGLDLFFDTNNNLVLSRNVLELVKNLANGSQITNIKQSLKEFVKTLFNDPEAKLAKQIDIIITKTFKSLPNLYKIDVIESNKNTIKNFVDSFLKAIINEETIFSEIIDNIFEQFVTINTGSTDTVSELKNTLILGVIKFISKDNDPKTIHIPTLMNKYKDKIINLFSKVDHIAYTKMINYLFDASKFDLKEGLYSVLFNKSYKDLAQQNISKIIKRSAPSGQNGKPRDNSEFKINVEIGLGLELVNLLSADTLLASLFRPTVQTFIEEVVKLAKNNNNQIDIKEVKKLDGYRATSRIYASITLLSLSNMTIDEYWPITGAAALSGQYAENYISSSIAKAYKEVIEKNSEIKTYLKTLNNDTLAKIGISNEIKYNDYFFAGYTIDNTNSRNVNFRNFSKWTDDSIMSFIANPEKTDNIYHNEKNIVLIAKLLQKGYLYKNMDNE
ncbi:hypothetical protein DMC14_000940 [Metamycoplasma phocicerebrale]|uniref:Uncharacterized protein n=1 Tax=Metamycoplasma phocicerebrale TaxID=142649 RepID=A0A3T0TTQ7_9BACT|nr:SGNH/GDSL hydrolase family protein [Metamycoplasma phocicerebrale]AZZ65359.1 hypothetical protein DMC14_000940 [Metamycoplasma phocicerebrale]